MRRNVSGQVVAARLVSRTDGSAITTGTVVVSVTGDNGTRTTGTVGSGNAVHKGGGLWTYAPSQAETDFAHIAFDFDVSTAVPATVQVYTAFPQTGDSFARLGAPSGASHAADVAAVGVLATAVKAKTDNLPGSPAAVGSAMTLTSAYDFAKGNAAMAESYSAPGQPKTPIQVLYELAQLMQAHDIVGTSWTARKLDGTTPAFTITLDSASSPTAAARAT